MSDGSIPSRLPLERLRDEILKLQAEYAEWKGCHCTLNVLLASVERELVACLGAPQEQEAVGDLLAYGREESGNALKAKDRDQYQFWQGWCSALERVPAAVLPPSPQEQERQVQMLKNMTDALADCLDIIEPLRDELFQQGRWDAAKCCEEVIAFSREALTGLLPPSQAWQPIESAPKDGTRILATSIWNQYAQGVMQWVDGNWLDWNDAIIPTDCLTHWQPMPIPPPPPSQEKEP